ncbi:MAG: exonuclease domain-containing protein [Tepidisphaerales bacterium]
MSITESILRDIPLAVVDTETTGASAAFCDRVCEVGIVRVEGGREVDRYQALINPMRPISPGASAITGITNEMVADAPEFSSLLPRILPMLRGAVLMGHNVAFDLSFLHTEFRRCRRKLADELLVPAALDTVRIARRRFGRGGNSLPILARRLGIEPTLSHRALADAQTTLAVFGALMAPVGGFEVSWAIALEQQGGAVDVLAAERRPAMPLELEEALLEQGQVEMEYIADGGEITRRIIRPLRIRRRDGQLSLVAFCQLRGGQRIFRVDRIVRLNRIDPDTQLPAEPA